jgi:transcription termination factor Rho
MADETLRPSGQEADQGPAGDDGEQQAKRTTRARRTTGAAGSQTNPAGDEAPKPRARRKKADDVTPAETSSARPDADGPPRRRRSPRAAVPVASSDALPALEPSEPSESSERAEERAPEVQSEPVQAPRARSHRVIIDLTTPDRGGDVVRPEPPRAEVEEAPRVESRPWTEERPRTEPERAREEPDTWEARGQQARPGGAPYEDDGGGRRRRKRDRRKKDRREGAPGGQGAPAGQGGPGNGTPQGAPYAAQGGYQNGQQSPAEPFEGMLELIGDKKFGFIRAVSTSLQKGDNDPFMPPPLIQKYNLRDGVTLKGTITRGRKGAWQVARVDEVMGMNPDDWKDVTDFDAGMVVYPDEKLQLVTSPSDVTMRVIDLVAPIGKGQRSLIVAPPRAGKTVILKQIAAGIEQNHPEIELIALLIDERPEEVTDFRRNTQAKVFASSNDFGEDNHVRVATLAFEYARRFVELGKDVVILLDSLTRLGRTFNLWGGNSGRTMSGGLDARALLIPRKIFGAARNIENGGSLTIIATALIETGSRMDDVIFEEFKGTGNAEIVLDRELADKRIYPAINIRKSGTRNEERLMPEEQIRQRHMLFRVLNARHPVEAMQALVRQIQLSPTNVHLLNELIPEQY